MRRYEQPMTVGELASAILWWTGPIAGVAFGLWLTGVIP